MCLFVDGGLGAGRDVLQLGLGVGTAVSFLREYHARVDVVELNPEVVQVAAEHFNYDRTMGRHGNTYVEDAHAFLREYGPAAAANIEKSSSSSSVEHRQKQQQKYAVVLHDVFVGYNPWPLLSREIFATIRDRWLLPDGKLLLNFVGYHSIGDDASDAGRAAAHRLTAAVLRYAVGLAHDTTMPMHHFSFHCNEHRACCMLHAPWIILIGVLSLFWLPC